MSSSVLLPPEERPPAPRAARAPAGRASGRRKPTLLLTAAVVVLGVAAIVVQVGGDLGGTGITDVFGGPQTPAGVALVLGDPRASGQKAWPGEFDAAPIKAFDFDNDGVQEVVAHSNNSKVYVFHGQTGRVLATLGTPKPPGWYIERVLNAAEAGVLVPGEPPSIVLTNPAAYVSVWQFVPAKSNGNAFTFEKKWEVRMPSQTASPGMDAKATLADLNGDKTLEIVVQTEEVGVYALKPDGTFLWELKIGGGNAEPAVGDLDGDGEPEVVFASDGGVISVIDGATGKFEWTFDASAYVKPASIPVAPLLAELDGHAPKEVVFVARDAHDEDNIGNNHVAIFAVRGVDWRGQLVWAVQPPWAHPLSYTQLVAHDVDGDGLPEIFGMDWNTMGHRPGNWEFLGPAHVFSLGSNGEERWVREVDAWWSNKNLALADVDGDGKQEVLANGARSGEDGLWVLDASTGRMEGFKPAAGWKVGRGPVLADLWGKGTMQLLLPVVPMEGPSRGAILVMDLEKPWRAAWPGYAPG